MNDETRTKPGSPEWHGELAEFWQAEIGRRLKLLSDASDELHAARKAWREHERAARGLPFEYEGAAKALPYPNCRRPSHCAGKGWCDGDPNCGE